MLQVIRADRRHAHGISLILRSAGLAAMRSDIWGLKTWVIRRSRKVVGCAGVADFRDGLIIHKIAVRRSAQCQGVGSELMIHLTYAYQDKPWIALCCRPELVSYYEGFGFERRRRSDEPVIREYIQFQVHSRAALMVRRATVISRRAAA